jgi:hypothetical protein
VNDLLSGAGWDALEALGADDRAEQELHDHLQHQWQQAGGHQPVPTSEPDAEAHRAVRAGIPTYLRLLRDGDPGLRIGMASLLGHFPSDWDAMSATLADRLAAERVPEVAAAICVAAGRAGRPADGPLVAALTRWRDHSDRYVHRCALIGSARTHPAPDDPMLTELAACLIMPDDADWRSPQVEIADAAASALGGRRPDELPRLAGPLLARLRRTRPDESAFLALELLLGLAFPGGPLPERPGFTGLTSLQQAVVRALVDSGELHRGGPSTRAAGECNLPGTHDDLAAFMGGAAPARR